MFLTTRHTLEACEEDSLLTHLHLLVKTSLLGQIAYAIDIFVGDGLTLEQHTTLIGQRDAVYNPYECTLSRTIGAQQTIDRALRYLKRHIAQSCVCRVTLGYVLNL